MPVLPTVLKCVHCGKATEVLLQSFEDPRQPGLPMSELVKLMAAHNLCKSCRDRYNWLASQGRSNEFLTERVAVILKPSGYKE